MSCWAECGGKKVRDGEFGRANGYPSFKIVCKLFAFSYLKDPLPKKKWQNKLQHLAGGCIATRLFLVFCSQCFHVDVLNRTAQLQSNECISLFTKYFLFTKFFYHYLNSHSAYPDCSNVSYLLFRYSLHVCFNFYTSSNMS